MVAALRGHEVSECRSLAWDTLRNSDLLDAAEAAGFQILITADQSLAHQQHLARRRIAIVALGSNRWQLIQRHLSRIVAEVEAAKPGSVREIPFPGE